MAVLLIAVAIYTVLSAAIQLNYRIHDQNRGARVQLQSRADRLHLHFGDAK